MNLSDKKAVVIGGGPGGLMAAEVLRAGGVAVTLYDRMPSVGRKLLIAGRGGLNLTHSEPLERFVARYGAAAPRLKAAIEAFPPAALIAWAQGLGQETFIGSSGRVFPKVMKASPLLRSWLQRLAAQGVVIKARHEWRGWDASGDLIFSHGDEVVRDRADVVVLALGGASWAKLGSNGAWREVMLARGVEVKPFRPSNSGFVINWSEAFRDRFEGEPLKGVELSFSGRKVRGEALITRSGIEGGAVYALSAALRDVIEVQGRAVLRVDLRPEMSESDLASRIERQRSDQSLANALRKALTMPPVQVNLLRESFGKDLANGAALARQIKSVEIALTGVQPIERAISSAGGVAFDAVDENFMIREMPGVYVVGEMLDWEAPTGGYLLQATFSSAVAAARDALRRLKSN